jgi:hypothetical protein
MSTLAQQAALASDPLFQTRIEAAMITAAANILAQGQGAMGPNTFALRTTLAASVMVNASDTPPLVTRFAWAVATNPTVAADIPAASVPIVSSAVQAAGPDIVTTYAAHGFTNGQIVEIDNAIDPVINGTWVITYLTTTTFSVPVLGTVMGGPGGYATLQPPDADIATAIAACWNAVAGVNTGTD